LYLRAKESARDEVLDQIFDDKVFGLVAQFPADLLASMADPQYVLQTIKTMSLFCSRTQFLDKFNRFQFGQFYSVLKQRWTAINRPEGHFATWLMSEGSFPKGGSAGLVNEYMRFYNFCNLYRRMLFCDVSYCMIVKFMKAFTDTITAVPEELKFWTTLDKAVTLQVQQATVTVAADTRTPAAKIAEYAAGENTRRLDFAPTNGDGSDDDMDIY
jgi:hypothetical protein